MERWLRFPKDTLAVVTGGTRGIGRAVVEALATAGAEVVFTFRTNDSLARELVDALKVKEMTAYGYRVDIADEKAVSAFFKHLQKKFARIDIMVNNAGIVQDGFAMMMSSEKWYSVLQTNLYGTFFAAKEAMKWMAKHRAGVIVNIASTSGISGQLGQANYAAAKAGVIGLTKTLALEGADYGIRVNAVAPGLIDTDMVHKIPPEQLHKLIDMIPLKRLGRPEEVANLVLFLASPLSSYITGKVYTIDGGLING